MQLEQEKVDQLKQPDPDQLDDDIEEGGNGMMMVMLGVMAYFFISSFAGGVNIPPLL